MAGTRFFRFFRYLTFGTLRKTLENAGKQRLPGLASEMAYNAVLAIFPATLAALTAIGLFGASTENTFQGLVSQLSQIAPEEVLLLVGDFVQQQLYASRNSGLFSLSFIAALWIASGALNSAMIALDHIFEVPPNQARPFWKAKLVAIVLTVGTIVLLVVASISVFVSDLIVRRVARESGGLEPGLLEVWRLLSWPFALGIVAIAAAFIYRYGPSRWRPGTPILPGAMLAALLWALVSGLFRLYVTYFGNYNQAYGAVGAVIVLLLWLYLSALALLLGAELNVSVGEAMQRSRRITPMAPSESSKSETR